MPRVAQLGVDQREAAAPRIRARRKPKTRTQYFAFLSYSHQDEELAKWLQRKLEQFQVPASLVGRLTPNGAIPRRLTPIFRDEHELAAADDLGGEIEAALDSSQCLVVLCSPKAAVSKWTNAEIATFKRVRPDGCVLAAIAAGEPFASDIPGREHEECFPPALRYRFDRRGQQTTRRAEPLAADLRHEGEGRRIGFLKLVAGMLGISLDELVQREATQRHRRHVLTTAASVSGMIVATALAVAAVQARDSARDQRREAEGLVAFMLGDLKDKLEPIGRLDALDGVGSRVLAYYSKQDASELSDAALVQRSQALSLTAQVAFLRGDMNTAQQLYAQAQQGTAEALRRDPQDPQRLFEHAQNVFWSGDLARRRGQVDRAARDYREYKRLADRMAALEPDNLRWRMEAAYGDLNMGIAFRNQRRFADAARQFARALGPIESVAAINRTNPKYQAELGNLLGWVADAERDQGHLDAAVQVRQRQIDFLRQRAADHPGNTEFGFRLITALQGLGVLLASQGDTAGGIEQFRLAIVEADRLIPTEPNNVLWKGLAAQARLELARSLLSLGQGGAARDELRAGCGLAAQVHAQDRGASWRQLQTDCLALRSRLALHSNSRSEALRLIQQALASARAERTEDPTRDRYRVAAVLRQLGDIRHRMGEGAAASTAWQAAFAQLPRDVAERPAEIHERAEISKRLGRKDQALALSRKLSAIGYRRTI